MNYDHHNGKPVKSVRNHGERCEITFEDDSLIDVPGNFSDALIGQSLLLVEEDGEDDKLVFGWPQKDGPAQRQAEISVPGARVVAAEETVEPVSEEGDRLATPEELEEAQQAPEKPSKGK
jgi:hypothetical protein